MKPTRDAVLQLAWSVLADLDLELVLERALDAARTLTGARYAALGVLDDDKRELARFLTAGVDAETAREIGPLPRGRGVLGELIRDPRPLRLDDVEAHPHAYGFPPAHPPMHSFLGVPILIAGSPYGILYLTEKEGDLPFDEEDEGTIVEIAEFAGLAIDHARRYEGSVARERSARRTAHALEATVAIARTLAGQTDLEVILDLIAKRGRALVGARAVLVELLEGRRVRVAALAGEVHPDLKGVTLAREESMAAAALQDRAIRRLGEDAEGPVARYGDGRVGFGFDDALAVPMILRGRVYGALLVLDPRAEGSRFSEGDEELLEAFAASATSAVATARSVDDERRRAQLAAGEAERARWAADLHDQTLATLAGLKDALAEIGSADDPADARRVSRRAAGALDAVMARLRSLITELRPPDLDRKGTEAALEELAEDLREAGVDVEMTVDLAFERGRDPRRHTSELETAVYRTVQAGLRNAAAHAAPGAKVSVAVLDEDEIDQVVVRIVDDGLRSDPGEAEAGHGLESIRERADLLGGHASVRSTAGDGLAIEVRLPVERRSRPEVDEAGLRP